MNLIIKPCYNPAGKMQNLKELNIIYRHWPAKRPKAVLLLVHGLGAHSARWEFLALFFAHRNISSYAIELKGFGQTRERPRGHIASFNIYYEDIMRLAEVIKRENPGAKIFLLGESLGGLICFILAGLYPDNFSGQILISPAFRNAMKFPPSAYLTLLTFFLIDQKKMVKVPFAAADCTSDKEYQEVMRDNPDELRAMSLKMILNTLLEQLKVPRLAKRLTLPSLFLIPGKDTMIDENVSRRIFNSLKLGDKTKIEYPEMLHALSIELGREKVFRDIFSWLSSRL